MNFAVVFAYSFDGETAVYLFEDEDFAKKFLADNYEEQLKEFADEEVETDAWISENGWYARIVNHYTDYDDVAEFRIGRVYQ